MVIFSLFPYNSQRFLRREFEQALWPQTGNGVEGRTLPVSFLSDGSGDKRKFKTSKRETLPHFLENLTISFRCVAGG